MMSIVMNNLTSINLVIFNGLGFIRPVLNSIKKQTFQGFEVNILDYDSSDGTAEIIKKEYPEFNLFQQSENLGFWRGQEWLLEKSRGKYIVSLTDVILNEYFLENAIQIMNGDRRIGALQAKVYQIRFYDRSKPEFTKIIDTLGFTIFKSRRVINTAQGELDYGQFNSSKEIFAVEGVAPIFRKEALEKCKINDKLVDYNYMAGGIGYGDDLDLAWRMRLFGWSHVYAPSVIAWHDRSTTTGYSRRFLDYLKRRPERARIDINKKRLDWRNTRFTIIKNDYTINVLLDLPSIVFREIMVLTYNLIFEPKVLTEIPNFFKLLPKILKTRKEIMKKAVVGPREIRKWFE